MHTGMVAAERTPVQPNTNPWSPGEGWARTATLHSVLKELRAANEVLSRLAWSAEPKLDGEELYDLGHAQSLVAGAVKKLQAAGARS